MSKTLIGTGFAIVLTAIGLLGSGWPSFLTSHPSYVLAFAALGGLAVLLGFLMLRRTEAKPSFRGSTLGTITNTSPINVTVGPFNMNANPVLPSPDSGAPNTPTLAPREERQARIWTQGAEEAKIGYSQLRIWTRNGGEAPALLVWVENKAPDVGELPSADARSLVASIVFYATNGTLLHQVSRAYWLDHPINRISLKIGHRSAVVVGVFEDGILHTYENSVSRLTQRRSRRVPDLYEPVPPHADDIDLGSSVDAVVTVLSEATGETVTRSRYRLTLVEHGCNALRIE